MKFNVHTCAPYGRTDGRCGDCGEDMSTPSVYPSAVVQGPLEVRVQPGESSGWTVEGWRGGSRLYVRAQNRTADEAWQHGAEWMRGELLKSAKETK